MEERKVTPLQIWAVSDGRAGMANQVQGLADAIARRVPADVTQKRLAVKPSVARLPRALWGSDPFRHLSAESDALEPPWPDLWIACGRLTIPYSMALKKRELSFVVQTQDPRAPLSAFDLVIPPHHDQVTGPNVLPITGAPNRLHAEDIVRDAEKLGPLLPARVKDAPRLAAVLLGGDSKAFRMTDQATRHMITTLNDTRALGYALLTTMSRRTPPAQASAVRQALTGDDIWIWDGAPLGALNNPYSGILGLADRFFVTEESANMLTDAAFTGKPITLLRLEGGGAKWRRLHEELTERGAIRRGAPLDEMWDYAPLRETDRVAAEIIERFDLSRK